MERGLIFSLLLLFLPLSCASRIEFVSDKIEFPAPMTQEEKDKYFNSLKEDRKALKINDIVAIMEDVLQKDELERFNNFLKLHLREIAAIKWYDNRVDAWENAYMSLEELIETREELERTIK